MTRIKNNINTYADLTAYNADLNKDFPNISYIQGSDEVKWNKYDPEYIVCKYYVTSTSSATKLLNSDTDITYQIIDGVQQDTVQKNYTFDTLGEHTVKYTLLDSTTIGEKAFYICTSLTSITIPSSVTSIGNAAFYNCTGLTSITVEAATPPTLSSANAFQNTNDCPIYVPAESVETFKTANNWSSLASRIQAIPTT